MIIHRGIEQGTEEWFALKAGKPSTSNFSKVMAKGVGKDSFGVTAKKYAKRLAAERVLKISLGSEFTSYDMERGIEDEPLARKYFSNHMFLNVEEITGIDNKGCFCSTDGLVGSNALLEIKCPKYSTHLEYLTESSKMMDKDYKWQLQGELFISEREFVYTMSYHKMFGDLQLIDKLYRDEEMIKGLEDRLELFFPLIDKYEEELLNLNKES